MSASIQFFSEEIKFKVPQPKKIKTWILSCIKDEGKSSGNINFIFCKDSYLHQINVAYLKHDTFTDIITFDNSEDNSIIEGDIYISIERIKENAEKFKVGFDDELHRVIIHGVLHLIGYSDKTSHLKQEMRKKEDAYLSLR